MYNSIYCWLIYFVFNQAHVFNKVYNILHMDNTHQPQTFETKFTVEKKTKFQDSSLSLSLASGDSNFKYFNNWSRFANTLDVYIL